MMLRERVGPSFVFTIIGLAIVTLVTMLEFGVATGLAVTLPFLVFLAASMLTAVSDLGRQLVGFVLGIHIFLFLSRAAVLALLEQQTELVRWDISEAYPVALALLSIAVASVQVGLILTLGFIDDQPGKKLLKDWLTSPECSLFLRFLQAVTLLGIGLMALGEGSLGSVKDTFFAHTKGVQFAFITELGLQFWAIFGLAAVTLGVTVRIFKGKTMLGPIEVALLAFALFALGSRLFVVGIVLAIISLRTYLGSRTRKAQLALVGVALAAVVGLVYLERIQPSVAAASSEAAITRSVTYPVFDATAIAVQGADELRASVSTSDRLRWSILRVVPRQLRGSDATEIYRLDELIVLVFAGQEGTVLTGWPVSIATEPYLIGGFAAVVGVSTLVGIVSGFLFRLSVRCGRFSGGWVFIGALSLVSFLFAALKDGDFVLSFVGILKGAIYLGITLTIVHALTIRRQDLDPPPERDAHGRSKPQLEVSRPS